VRASPALTTYRTEYKTFHLAKTVVSFAHRIFPTPRID